MDRQRADLKAHAERFVQDAMERIKGLEDMKRRFERPFEQSAPTTTDISSVGADIYPSPSTLSEVEKGFLERYVACSSPASSPELGDHDEDCADNPQKKSKLPAGVMGSQAVWLPNDIVEEMLRLVRDEYAGTIRSYYLLERFVRLHLPKTEEGAPVFYVGLQSEVCRAIVDSRRRMEAEFYELDAYHEARADAIERACCVTVERARGSKSQVGGEKAGDSTWTSDERKYSHKGPESVISSRNAFVAAKDAKWFFRLHSNLQLLITEVAALAHLLELNFAKVVNPRDSASDAPMSMY